MAYGGTVIKRRAARHRDPDNYKRVDRQGGVEDLCNGPLRLPQKQRLQKQVAARVPGHAQFRKHREGRIRRHLFHQFDVRARVIGGSATESPGWPPPPRKKPSFIVITPFSTARNRYRPNIRTRRKKYTTAEIRLFTSCSSSSCRAASRSTSAGDGSCSPYHQSIITRKTPGRFGHRLSALSARFLQNPRGKVFHGLPVPRVISQQAKLPEVIGVVILRLFPRMRPFPADRIQPVPLLARQNTPDDRERQQYSAAQDAQDQPKTPCRDRRLFRDIRARQSGRPFRIFRNVPGCGNGGVRRRPRRLGRGCAGRI